MSISRHQAVGAYRRWEPAEFGSDEPAGTGPTRGKRPPRAPVSPEPEAAPGAAAAPSPASTPGASPAAAEATAQPEHALSLPPDFHLPTADEIERMHEEVRAAGFAEGREAGYAEGLEAGRAAGYAEGKAQAESEAARLAGLADGLDEALHALDNEVAEEIMALAIEMARRMVRLTLAEHPETVLETVRSALLQLPQGHAQIHLHPDDMALVRQHLGEQLSHGGHRLQEDARLQRGECRIDGQGAQVDATLETRWRRVLESIGHDRARWQVRDEDPGQGEEAPA
ncbi:MAG TPA: flagellar assembly protein FliH [Thauera sp.]|nr:flagellar assembly protein FliH [Thauera sp.]HHW65691.1 flagellar assembly protein FliH [Rhodocyclaceae bacterium]